MTSAREEIIGKSSREIGNWCHQDARQAFIEALQRDGYCMNFEADQKTRDGQIIRVLISAHPITVKGEALKKASESCRMHFYQAFLEVLAGRLSLANARLAAF